MRWLPRAFLLLILLAGVLLARPLALHLEAPAAPLLGRHLPTLAQSMRQVAVIWGKQLAGACQRWVQQQQPPPDPAGPARAKEAHSPDPVPTPHPPPPARRSIVQPEASKQPAAVPEPAATITKPQQARAAKPAAATQPPTMPEPTAPAGAGVLPTHIAAAWQSAAAALQAAWKYLQGLPRAAQIGAAAGALGTSALLLLLGSSGAAAATVAVGMADAAQFPSSTPAIGGRWVAWVSESVDGG